MSELRRDRVVVLDRDGTVVVDRGYLADAAGLEFLPRAADGLRTLHEAGYRLVMVSNQSGVGRGLFSLERLQAQHVRLRQMVSDAGAQLAGIYWCPHLPEAGCDCRKPALGLLRQAGRELGFAPSTAVIVGDKACDAEFGRRAGATTILITNGAAANMDVACDFQAPDLAAAARWIIERSAYEP